MNINIEERNDYHFITINNEIGMKITLCSLGASIFDLFFKDKKGNLESIVIRPKYDTEFYSSDGYYGKSIGRFAGRIDKAICNIDDVEYELFPNWKAISALHGTDNCISHERCDFEIIEKDDYIDVIFTYLEKETTLPGDVNYEIIYRIFSNENTFTIFMNAISNKKTILNLTNHTYFNLSGNGKRTILDQNLQLFCDRYTKLNDELITTSIERVDKVMDFQKGKLIGKHINDKSLQKHTAFGYDHCFFKTNEDDDLIAIMIDKKSSRKLSIYSSLPSIVCYSGNYIDTKQKFNIESTYPEKYHGITFECQFIPNGINMENVETSLFDANEKYSHYITYKLDVI